MKKSKDKMTGGFTLIEVIVVIAVLAIIAAIVIPNVLKFTESARLTADKSTVRVLNGVTSLCKLNYQSGDPFRDESKSSNELMEVLVDAGYIANILQPQSSDAVFSWHIQSQVWFLFIGNAPVPLSPLGSTFNEISSAMIALIVKKYETDGKYGRTWGDFTYADIGLDPADWQNPIQHTYFKPGGATLRIRPETGYSFIVTDIFGATRTLKSSYNWDLVYNDLDKKWYYHSIATSNEIDINTLVISDK